MIAFKIILCIAIVFIALSLLCAMWIGRCRPVPADPFSIPFGEMPGFSAEQLRAIAPPMVTDDPLRRSFAVRNQLKRDAEWLCRLQKHSRERDSAGVALRSDNAGGEGFLLPHRPVAARMFGWWRHG